MIRFCRNSKLEKSCRVTDIFTPDELKEAEKRILLIVQRTSFVSGKNEGLKNIPYVVDQNGLLRMKTRLTFREDTQDFKFPVILPSDHPVVTKFDYI
ncbi:hypothetical protein CEXT_534341 [Caerostris extrusa]|uniref:Uncharacterized protein n=1 Tax=Caerostris extrusa TaxID=172846 RepID=A0AAV4VDU0_CAEEX|nr:hypothetical protein CEXT_534341 [Caerostris extrusa]